MITPHTWFNIPYNKLNIKYLSIALLFILTQTVYFPGLVYANTATVVRLKDIASIKGNRENSIIGLGIVVGLAGTGDTPAFLATNKIVTETIKRLGIHVDETSTVTSSVALVTVSARLPAFSKNGVKLPVKVSVLGDATSLEGGILLPTQLKAGNSLVYAVAEGQIITAQSTGVGAQSYTAATIPLGATVEREFNPDIIHNGSIVLHLRNSDFTNSARITEAINTRFKGFYAESTDPFSVKIKLPAVYGNRLVEFIADMEAIKIKRDNVANIIINERTGTIVMGKNVTINPVVIAHGDLTISVQSDADNQDQETNEHSISELSGATVGDLISSLNALGVKPADLIGILQALDSANAINAKLIIM